MPIRIGADRNDNVTVERIIHHPTMLEYPETSNRGVAHVISITDSRIMKELKDWFKSDVRNFPVLSLPELRTDWEQTQYAAHNTRTPRVRVSFYRLRSAEESIYASRSSIVDMRAASSRKENIPQ